jgi:hypothetical protein
MVGRLRGPSQKQGFLDNLGESSMMYLPFYMIVKFLHYVMTTLCTQHPLVFCLPLTIAIKLPQICWFTNYQIVQIQHDHIKDLAFNVLCTYVILDGRFMCRSSPCIAIVLAIPHIATPPPPHGHCTMLLTHMCKCRTHSPISFKYIILMFVHKSTSSH